MLPTKIHKDTMLETDKQACTLRFSQVHLQQQLFFLLNPKRYLLTKSPLTLAIRPN